MRDVLVPLVLIGSVVFAFSLPALPTARAFSGSRDAAPRAHVYWSRDIADSLERARVEDKLVVLYFGAAWDSAAKELETQTFPDAAVEASLRQDFVTVHIDTTDDDQPEVRALQNQFKVVGDPTIIVLSRGAHQEILRFNEFVKPETFASALRVASDQKPDKSILFRW